MFLPFSSYQSTLKQLFQEFESKDDSNSQLAAVTMRIMQALQTNLDGKSKQYRDPSLTHLFLMNNIHYMVRSVRRFANLRLVIQPNCYLVLVVGSNVVFFWLLVGLKLKTCQGMIGFRDIGELCSNMQINIRGLLGQRL